MSPGREVLFPIGQNLICACLLPADMTSLQQFVGRCNTYDVLFREEVTGVEAAWKHALARVGGILEGESLTGVLDFLPNCPEAGVWFIGMLLIDPEQRRQGLGARVYRAFEAWAGRCGAHTIELGVVEANASAYRFWQRMGFGTVGTRQGKGLSARESGIIVMRRTLDAAG